MSCLRVEPAEAGGGLGAKRTHLTVFAAQPVGTHGVWLQGARGGVATEIQTFLQRGVGFVGHGHRGQLLMAGGGHKRKQEPEGLALGLKTSLTERIFICEKAKPWVSAFERRGRVPGKSLKPQCLSRRAREPAQEGWPPSPAKWAAGGALQGALGCVRVFLQQTLSGSLAYFEVII